MSEIFDLDPIDDNNTARWPENMLASAVNNSARQDEGMLARDFRDRTAYAQTSGTSTAYTLTPARTIAALSATTRQTFRAHTTCGASPTLNLGGLGAFPIRKNFNVALSAGDISGGQIVEVAWDAANSAWQLLSTVSQTLNNQAFGLKVGDVKLSMSSSPDSGFIRLTETAQVFNRTAYPDLSAWAITQPGYPWGASVGGTTFAVPPAGGYVLRFGASNTSVNPDGAQSAGTTTTDRLKQTTIPATGLTASSTSSSSAVVSGGVIAGTSSSSVPATGGTVFPIGASSIGVSVTTSTSTTVSGAVTLPGGTETAPKTVQMFADMLAVPALVASGLVGVGGFAYKWTTNTATSDPGSGYLKVNNATFTSATALYVSETGSNSAPLASILQSLPTGTRLYIVKVGAPSTFVYCSLTSVATDNGTWDSFNITPIGASVSSLADGDDVAVIASMAGTSGANGATGASGPVAIDYTWDTGTTLADPGSGKVRASVATFSGSFSLYINETDRLGNNLATFLQSWGASTNTTTKGVLELIDLTTPANRTFLKVTGTVTDNGTYDTIPVTYQSGATSLSAVNIGILFSPAGDKGADGAGSFTSLSPGAGTTSDVTANAPGSAITTSGTLSAAELVNAQVGTTYTVGDGDRAKLVTFTNAASIAVTLPQAGQATTFKSGWFVDVVNLGAGTVTITPTTSTINGAATLVLTTGQGCRIVSDGTNYQISNKPLPIAVSGTAGTTMTFPASSSTVLTTGNTATITKGFTVAPNSIGTVSTGTTTPDPTLGNYQYYTNNGAHTLAAPASDCAIDILVTNGASAGAITFSGFTVGANTGDALTTTNTNKFIVSIRRINSVSTYILKALQ